MTGEVLVEQVQDEAEALAASMAGYNSRGATPPEETEAPAAEREGPANDDTPAEPSVADKLEALKAEVKAMRSANDPATVRKLHGEIGNINRTILQMQAAPKGQEPSADEVANALKAVEALASEDQFPEIAGPMVAALKAIAAKSGGATPQIDIDAVVAQKMASLRQQDAKEALSMEHPDWEQIKTNPPPEYKEWLASQTPEFRNTYLNTWNPAVVSKGLTAFKASLAEKQKKQTRLASAITPKGESSAPISATIPDAEGFNRGYYGKHKRPS